VKQLRINIPGNEEIVNKKIKEEFTLKNTTLYEEGTLVPK